MSPPSKCPVAGKAEAPPHKLLAIPGPIEVSDEVLHAIAQPPLSHVSPEFVKFFKESMDMTRQVLFTRTGLPFLIAGSGTLGWDLTAANLIESGDEALVLSTGYFGSGFADCLTTYGARVTTLHAPHVGSGVPLADVERALLARKYKLVTITHVDTSTSVLSDIEGVAACVRRVSPATLVVVDGVCSVGSEEVRMDAWGLDVVIAASQKGLGAPPGLSIVVASEKAIKVFEARKEEGRSYYASWKKWLPIMRAYDAGKPAYFGTQPTNLVRAYHASLLQLTRGGNAGLEERFEVHRQVKRRIEQIAGQLGLKSVVRESDGSKSANGMTAVYLPEGLRAQDVVPRVGQKGVVIAGGLVGEIKDKYIRIGHMGVSVTDEGRGDIDRIEGVLRQSLAEVKAESRKRNSTVGGGSLVRATAANVK